MAGIKTEGAEALANLLQSLGEKTGAVAKKCAYDGARVMTDAIVAAVNGLQPDSDGYKAGTDPLRVITTQDRKDLAGCVGVSRIENDGLSTTVSVSFDGYITRKEKAFPKGVPAAMIARSIESGSSVRAKAPFVRPAVRGAETAVLDTMQATFDESVEQIKTMEG